MRNFFAGDTEQYQHQFMSWVELLRTVGVQVVIVTTAPVAEPTEYVPRAKIFVKRLIRKPTQLDSIVQFNEWLKEYAQRGRIPVFDLWAQLQRSNSERWLRSEYGGVLDLDLTALDRQAEFIAINQQPNDDVVHLDRFRNADRLAHQTLETCASRQMLPLDVLRVALARMVRFGIEVTPVCSPIICLKACDPQGLQ
jgi:hypothetical protein